MCWDLTNIHKQNKINIALKIRKEEFVFYLSSSSATDWSCKMFKWIAQVPGDNPPSWPADPEQLSLVEGVAEELEWDDLWGPFQLKLFWDAVVDPTRTTTQTQWRAVTGECIAQWWRQKETTIKVIFLTYCQLHTWGQRSENLWKGFPECIIHCRGEHLDGQQHQHSWTV